MQRAFNAHILCMRVIWAIVLCLCRSQAGAGGEVNSQCLEVRRDLMRMRGGRGGVPVSIGTHAGEGRDALALDQRPDIQRQREILS
jgi:hypothetical protein